MTSSCGGQAVDRRHWNFGWAITFGASAITVAAAAVAALACTMNPRRPMTI